MIVDPRQWELERCDWPSPKLGAALNAGWEPFAVTTAKAGLEQLHHVWLRRYVGEPAKNPIVDMAEKSAGEL